MQHGLHGIGKRLNAVNRTEADGFMFDFFFLNHSRLSQFLLRGVAGYHWRTAGVIVRLDLKYYNKMSGNLRI